jgi:hypothetical protein
MVIWLLIAFIVAPTAAIAATWSDVPAVNALELDRAVCNAVNEIGEPDSADSALSRSAVTKPDRDGVCAVVVPD